MLKSSLLLIVMISCSLLASAKDKEKDSKPAGICAALEGKEMTQQEQVLCLRAHILTADKEKKESMKKLKKLATPEEKTVLNQERAAEEHAKQERKAEAKLYQDATITGCTELPELTWRAGQPRLGAWVSLSVNNEVQNNEPVEISVSNGIGTVVKNLCAGGDMNLFLPFIITGKGLATDTLTPLLGLMPVTSRTYVVTAKGMIRRISVTQTVTVNWDQSSNENQAPTFKIVLPR